MKHLQLRWISLIILAVAAVDAYAGENYSIKDLGSAVPFAINDNGQVAGTYYYGNNAGDLFIYENDKFNDIGKISDGPTFSLNNSGQLLIGESLYSNGHFTSIKDNVSSKIPYTTTYVSAGLNNQGNVVGTDVHWNDTMRTVDSAITIWNANSKTLSSTFEFNSNKNTMLVRGINDNNQVVGTCSFNYGNDVACVKMVDQDPVSLGTIEGYSRSLGLLINNAGQVAGDVATDTGNTHAFLYSNGTMTDIGTFGGKDSNVVAMNDLGQVVGYAYYANNPIINGQQINTTRVSFLYSNGQLTDLNTLLPANSEWDLGTLAVTGINDKGQIIGMGLNHGLEHGFILSPVPEPPVYAMLVIGACMLARARKRLQK